MAHSLLMHIAMKAGRHQKEQEEEEKITLQGLSFVFLVFHLFWRQRRWNFFFFKCISRSVMYCHNEHASGISLFPIHPSLFKKFCTQEITQRWKAFHQNHEDLNEFVLIKHRLYARCSKHLLSKFFVLAFIFILLWLLRSCHFQTLFSHKKISCLCSSTLCHIVNYVA